MQQEVDTYGAVDAAKAAKEAARAELEMQKHQLAAEEDAVKVWPAWGGFWPIGCQLKQHMHVCARACQTRCVWSMHNAGCSTAQA